MELFLENGHLTDEGLQAVIDEKLNELQRLEASEHLSFCDFCLVRYTSMLENVDLYTPAQPLLPPVAARLRQKFIKVVFSKYATAAAAVALAVTLTVSGVFSPDNISAVSNAMSLNGIFNITAPAQHNSNVPKIPDAKIPAKQEIKVPKKEELDIDIPHKKVEDETENPAKLVAKMENPLLQFIAPKEQTK